MKLKITIDGQAIDLNPNMKATLERFNPLLNFESIRGAMVVDFEVPFSPTNDKVFGHYRNRQVGYPDRSYYCEKTANGLMLEKGVVELRNVTERGYLLSFTQNLGEIFGDYQTLPINLIDWGSETIPGTILTTADHLTAKYCFPTILNPSFYGKEAVSGFAGKVNEWTGSAWNPDAPMVPMFFLRWLFEEIAELCDFTFQGEFFESDLFKKCIIYNTFSLDDRTTIEYKSHLPAMSIPELLKGLRKLYNLVLFFDVQNRVLTAKFGKTLFNQPVTLNLSSKIVPSYNRSPERANRLELDWQLDSTDGLMKVPPSDFLRYQTPQDGIRKGTLFSVVSSISTLPTDVTGFAKADQPGITPIAGQLNNSFSPRVLFWHGVVSGHPTATNTLDDVTLAWHGSNNLVVNFWQEYRDWRAATSLKQSKMNLSAKEIYQLDFHGRQGEYISAYINGRNYLIGDMKTPLPIVDNSDVSLWEM